MSKTTNGISPAFCQSITSDPDGSKWTTDEYDAGGGGLTKREYFAAKAMQAFFSIPEIYLHCGIDGVARDSVRAADALLDALEQEGGTK